MCDPVTLAIVGAVIGLGTTVYGTSQANAASDRSLAAQRRAESIKQAREKRQAIREARIKRASIIQAGANQGATSTSAVSGGAGSIDSQLSGTLSFLDQVGGAMATAYKEEGKANTYKGIASLGATIFDVTKGAAFDSIFGKAPVKASTATTGSLRTNTRWNSYTGQV